MANFSVNEKSRTISVEGPLTALEREIIGTYVMGGYKVKEKRISKVIRLQRTDIEKYFEEVKDEKEKLLLEKFKNKEKEQIVDKNGILRDSGFLKAMSWLKDEHYKTYDAIMTKKENNEETTKKRREREAKAKAKETSGETENK